MRPTDRWAGLVAAVEGSPFRAAALQREPGRRADDVLARIADHLPAFLGAADDTVTGWWSWHDGTAASNDCISPDGLALTPLRFLPDVAAMIRERATIPLGHTCAPLDDGQFFPLSTSMFGDVAFLQRSGPHEPWTIWQFQKETAILPPHGRPGEPPLRFDDDLATLTAALPRLTDTLERDHPYTTPRDQGH